MKEHIKKFLQIVRKCINHARKALKMLTTSRLMKDKRFIRMSHGNKKLRDTLETAFLIWNLPAITTCPYATEECKKNCYACKAEKQYPDVIKSRYAHLEISKAADFVDRMIFTINTEWNSQRVQKFTNRTLVVRIHESGDFYDREYAMKWLEIARHFESNENIVFMAYTKSLPFFRGVELPSNFKIRASVWCDTGIELEKESFANYPVYTAYTEDEIEAMKESMVMHEVENVPSSGCEWMICRCSDCGSCKACWNDKIKNIAVVIH